MNPSPPEKILIIQTAFIGDVILTTPLIEATKMIFPNADIHFLTIPATANLVESHPNVDKCLIFDKRGRNRGMLNLFRFAQQLKAERYDLALIPHRSLRSAMLVFLANVPQRIGFDRSAGSFLFTQKIKYPQHVHEVDRNLTLLQQFHKHLPKLMPRIFPTSADARLVEEFLNENGLTSAKFLIAIAPGSVWATKRWLKEGYAELCAKLKPHRELKIILVGGAADRELCDWIRQHSGSSAINTAGKFSLRQSADLIRRCCLLVTNDSGPMHLGVAMKTQVIALFGPTVRDFGFFPCGDTDIVIEKNVYCRPCSIHGGNECPTGTFSCMTSITADEIYDNIIKILAL